MEGCIEALVIADTDILKHILVKDFTDFTNRRVSSYTLLYIPTRSLYIQTYKQNSRSALL